MKIDSYAQDSKKDYRNELRRLDQANQQLASTKERDLENLKKVYQKKTETIRNQGEEKLVNLRDELSLRQQQEITANEEILAKYQDQLSETQSKLAKQQADLTLAQRERMKNQQTNFSDTLQSRQGELEETTLLINDRMNEQVKEIAQQSQYQISDQSYKAQSKLDQLAENHDVKFQDQARNYQLKERDEELKHYQNSAMAQMHHQKEISGQQMKNNIEFGQRETIHKSQLESLEKFNSQKIRDQHEAFKQKVLALSQEQERMIKNVNDQFQKEMQSMISTHASKKRDVASKMDDQFYHVSTINPQLIDTEKAYIITLALPEHEKEGARLSAHDRQVRLNFTRSFEDQVSQEDGSTHKSKRSEIISKEFNVKEIVNSNKITQQYKDGLLTFVLPKK